MSNRLDYWYRIKPMTLANLLFRPMQRSLQLVDNKAAMEAASPLENNTCPSIYHSWLIAGTGRRKRMSYDRSSLYQSVRLAQRKVLKDLDLVGIDYKLKEGAIQDYANWNCCHLAFSNHSCLWKVMHFGTMLQELLCLFVILLTLVLLHTSCQAFFCCF
jgi:hypothetical protein